MKKRYLVDALAGATLAIVASDLSVWAVIFIAFIYLAVSGLVIRQFSEK